MNERIHKEQECQLAGLTQMPTYHQRGGAAEMCPITVGTCSEGSCRDSDPAPCGVYLRGLELWWELMGVSRNRIPRGSEPQAPQSMVGGWQCPQCSVRDWSPSAMADSQAPPWRL